MSNQSDKRADNGMLRRIFFRSCALELSYNYEKMQALGVCYCMMPALKRFYGRDSPEFTQALMRHMALFNITPAMVPFVLGISASLEQEKSRNPAMDEGIINRLKTSLMGPLSGIGDSFFWGTFRIIAAGIGISMAQSGSILGPIIFFLLFNLPNILVRWFGLKLGFSLGTKLIDRMADSNIMDRVNKVFGIIGLMCVGGMTATMVDLKLALNFSMAGAEVSIQHIIDEILPNLLPLGITLLCYRFIQKGISVNKILIGLVVFGIAGKAIGLI